MVVFPNVKINIGLNILRKRGDGYHDIQSIFYPVSLHDSVEAIKSNNWKFHSEGLPVPGNPEENIIHKAFKLLRKDFDIPGANTFLYKAIPTGAGLGGGSADGAFVLNLFNHIFDLDLSEHELENYAAQLGSDCPFFIRNKPTFVTGRGETLENIDLDLSEYFIVLINPGIHIPTAEAYSNIQPQQPDQALADLIKLPVTDWKNSIRNDFEVSVFKDHPEIKSIKEDLYKKGALYASMTGSGSTVYGIFKDKPNLRAHFLSYFYWSGRLA